MPAQAMLPSTLNIEQPVMAASLPLAYRGCSRGSIAKIRLVYNSSFNIKLILYFKKQCIDSDISDAIVFTHERVGRKDDGIGVDLWIEEAAKQKKEYTEKSKKLHKRGQQMFEIEEELKYRPRNQWTMNKKYFTEAEILQLRKQFEILHNQLSQDELLTYSTGPRPPILTVKSLAQKYGCSTLTMNTYYRRWRLDPTLSECLGRFKQVCSYSFRGKQYTVNAYRNIAKRIQQLAQILSEQPFITVPEIVEAMKINNPVENYDIDKQAIKKYLMIAGFRRKNLKVQNPQKNSSKNIQLRRQFAIKLKQLLDSSSPVYFYDELLLHPYFNKDSGWCKANSELHLKPEKLANRSIVVLGLMSSKAYFLWDAKYGNYSQPEFKQIIRKLFEAVLSYQKGTIVINKNSHRDLAVVYETAAQYSWKILTLPAQNLELNPLYPYFNNLSQHLRRLKFDNVAVIFPEVVKLLKLKESPKQCARFINKLVTYYILKAIKSEPFK